MMYRMGDRFFRRGNRKDIRTRAEWIAALRKELQPLPTIAEASDKIEGLIKQGELLQVGDPA